MGKLKKLESKLGSHLSLNFLPQLATYNFSFSHSLGGQGP